MTFPVLVGTTDAYGRLSFRAPLPDCPVFLGDLHCQWSTFTGGALRTSRGLRLQIR